MPLSQRSEPVSERSAPRRQDFVLIGGGIVGACLAEELARAGARVLVLDAGTEAGHATTRAAGVAVPSIRYAGDPVFAGWLRSARAVLDTDLARLEPQPGAFSLRRPILRLLREEDLQALAGLPDAGLGEPVSGADLGELVPGLPPAPDRTAYLAPDGLVVTGAAYLSAARAAALAAGACWQQGSTVLSIEDGPDGVELSCTDGARVHADRVIITAGAWTGQLVDLPVGPQRGQLVKLSEAAGLSCILSGRLYIAPLPSGGVFVGATEEDAGFATECTAGSIARILSYAVRTLPGLEGAGGLQVHAGLRPITPSGRPLMGAVPGRSRLYVAAGHAGHGLVTARLSAQGMAQGLLHRDWDALPEQFCPSTALVGAAR